MGGGAHSPEWTGRGFRLGTNKRGLQCGGFRDPPGFNLETLNERNKYGAAYTVFSDARRPWTAQYQTEPAPLAKAHTGHGGELLSRGCTITRGWAAAHKAVEGKEMADFLTGAAADSAASAPQRHYLRRRAWPI